MSIINSLRQSGVTKHDEFVVNKHREPGCRLFQASLHKVVIPVKKGIRAFFNKPKKKDFAPLPDMTRRSTLGTRGRERLGGAFTTFRSDACSGPRDRTRQRLANGLVRGGLFPRTACSPTC